MRHTLSICCKIMKITTNHKYLYYGFTKLRKPFAKKRKP